jgi:hypothetical protein
VGPEIFEVRPEIFDVEDKMFKRFLICSKKLLPKLLTFLDFQNKKLPIVEAANFIALP